MIELEEQYIYRDPIPSRATCFRKEGAERSGPGTDSGSRGYNKPTWTSSRSTVISREEHPDSCRKLARGPWTLGKTAKHAVLAADYSVFIPVCLPWGILPSGLEAPNKSAETVPRHALAVRVAMLVMCRAPCLLYTSPSPRDLSTSRMPSSA